VVRTVALVLGVFALAASASGSAATARATSLTITYWARGADTSTPLRWTLRCNPAGGTLARPAAACRRLAAGGMTLFAPVPEDVVCTQIWGGPQTARVVGKLAGRSVWATFMRTNGCHIARWDRVSPWLLPAPGAA
jgi:Subtilisin inhibitor-like